MKRIYLLIISILLIPTISFACGIEKEYIYPVYDTTQEVIIPEETENYDLGVKFTDQNQEITYEILLKNTCSEEVIISDISISDIEHNIFNYSYNNITVDDIFKANEEKIILLNITTTEEESEYDLNQDLNLNITYGVRRMDEKENPETGAFISISSILILLALFIIVNKLKKKYKKIETIILIITFSILSSIIAFAKIDIIGTLTIKGNIIYNETDKNTYIVEIDPNDGKYKNIDKVYKIKVEEETKINLNDIKREDYEFIDWTLNETDKYTEKSIVILEETSLLANWKQVNFNLNINPNGGIYENNSDITTMKIGINERYELYNPIRKNYKFIKWEETSETNYLVDNIVTIGESNAEVTAKWCLDDGKSHTITLNANPGELKISSVNRTNGHNYELPYPNKEGYTFNGWYDEFDIKVNNDDCVDLTENLVLNAKYVQNNYNVTFNANGGICQDPSSKQVIYDEEYGELPTCSRSGYTFNGWYDEKTNGTQILESTIVNIAKNHTIYAHWIANDDTKYIINHHLENLNTTGYTLIETDDLKGTTDSKITPAIKSYIGFTAPSQKEININGDGSTVLDYYYTRNSYNLMVDKTAGIINETPNGIYKYESNVNIVYDVQPGYSFKDITGDKTTASFTMPAANVTLKINATPNQYTITFNGNGGSCNKSTKIVTFDATYGELANCTRPGYTFYGWYDKNNNQVTSSTYVTDPSNQTLTANWIVHNDTPYTVKHYLENVNSEEYTLKDTDNLKGTTDSKIKPILKSYIGFTAPNQQEITINGDGSTILNYYYKRNSYNVSIEKTNGIFNITGNGEHEYESNISITYQVTPGYSFTNITGDKTNTSFIMPAENVTLKINATPNQYTVTFNSNGGSCDRSTKKITFDSTYGELTSCTRQGYTFNGWYDNVTSGNLIQSTTLVTTPSDHTLYAQWTPNSNTPYVVKHHLQNLNSTEYTLKDTENLTGTTDSKIKPGLKSYSGFTAPPQQEITIKADGTTILNYYYTRNSYSLIVNKSTGVSSVTGGGTYQYESDVSISYQISSGYTYSNITGDKTSTSFKMPASNVTLKVNATPNTYTVTLNQNGGTCTSTSKTVTYDSTYGTLPTCTKTGYNFDGWYDSNSTQITASTSVKILSNQTLTAKYTAITSTLTFDANGGNCTPTSKKITYDGTYGDLATCSRTGYTFSGWYTTKTGTDKITSTTKVTITTNQTLYAQWKGNTYSISYNANGGTGNMGNTSCTYGSNCTLTANAFSKTGYTFNGWNTNTSGTGTNYSDKTTVSNLATSGTFKLYAKWKAAVYTITYNMNGGTNYSNAPTNYTYGVGTTINGTPTRNGYTFMGWCENSGLTSNCSKTKTISTTSTGNKTYYAKWSASYTITYNMNGGTNYSNAPTSYTNGVGVTINGTPTRTGYSFVGWCENSGLTSNCSKTKTISTTSTGNKTYYAKWVDDIAPKITKFVVKKIGFTEPNLGAYGGYTIEVTIEAEEYGSGISEYVTWLVPYGNGEGGTKTPSTSKTRRMTDVLYLDRYTRKYCATVEDKAGNKTADTCINMDTNVANIADGKSYTYYP